MQMRILPAWKIPLELHLAPADAVDVYKRQIQEDLDPLEDLYQLVDAAIVDDPPYLMRDGGMITVSYTHLCRLFGIFLHRRLYQKETHHTRVSDS